MTAFLDVVLLPGGIVEEPLHHPLVVSVLLFVIGLVVRGLGAGVDVGAAAPVLAYAVLRLGVWVVTLVAWAIWSQTRRERGLGAGVLCFSVVSVFGQFPL